MNLWSQSIQYLQQHRWPIVIGVSGWPDSMAVCDLVRNYMIENKWDLTQIHIAHYHHGQRSQSDVELLLVKQYCETYQLSFHIDRYEWTWSSERDLRIVRHEFFRTIMQQARSNILITGHNLTDRIETSFLNMTRWCQIQGFINMQEIDTQYYTDTDQTPLINSYTILRPLLEFSKKHIQSHCDTQKIPYMIDQGNTDVTISSRNLIRHTITSRLNVEELSSRNTLYHNLESQQFLYIAPTRNESVQWYEIWPTWEYSLDHLAWLFRWSSSYHDMTQGRLLERQQWLWSSYQWHKVVGQWKWWIKHKKIWLMSMS